jgi:hypothetical protein
MQTLKKSKTLLIEKISVLLSHMNKGVSELKEVS